MLLNFCSSLCRHRQRRLDSLKIRRDQPCVWFGGEDDAAHLHSLTASLHFNSAFATLAAKTGANSIPEEKGALALDHFVPIVLHSEKVDQFFKGSRLHSY